MERVRPSHLSTWDATVGEEGQDGSAGDKGKKGDVPVLWVAW